VRRLLVALLALALLAALPGCGGGGGDSGLKVSAAASLSQAFDEYGRGFQGGKVSFSFAGSDELAAQIREGVKPDVFAAANAKLPSELAAEGLVERPVAFASNTLVIAVPRGSRIRSLGDLGRSGARIAAGAASVPVGSYTRQVLQRLGGGEAAAIERNIRSNEPDVAGVVAKVAQGAVDAGFVYLTDVRNALEKLRAIRLPASLQPQVVYEAAVVKGAAHRALARRFVTGLLAGPGAAALREAGFKPPPHTQLPTAPRPSLRSGR
jgi:molybdate transport system substrate-binding protein